MKGAELHFAIAHNVRIRRTSSPIFANEIVDDPGLVFCGGVERDEWNVETRGDAHRLAPISGPGARHPRRIPPLDEDSGYLRASLLQERGCDGRIYAP